MDEPYERAHYSNRKIEKPYVAKRFTGRDHTFKPRGLWYSAPCNDDGWEHWCVNESFRLKKLAYKHRLELDFTNIRVIRNVGELDEFHMEYGHDDELGEYEHDGRVHKTWHSYIDWREVRADYHGIEIAPYQWSRRMPGLDRISLPERVSRWYYSWDCASGCVWNRKALLGWKHVPS